MVFWVSTILVTVFVLIGLLFPESFTASATLLFDYTTAAFGWLYLLAVVFFIGFCFYLAFGPYGKLRLGRDEDRPEFSFFTWIAMLFSAGFGVGLVFWGVAEPVNHFFAPPLGIMPGTNEAARTAIRYSMFHWGIHQWSVFAVVGLALGYFQYRKSARGLLSTALEPLIGSTSRFRNAIDILAVIATATGVATSLGLGVMQITSGLGYVFGLPTLAVTQLIIMAILLGLYLLSSTTGLHRGIKILSNLNLGLALSLLIFVLVFGPTVFILNTFTNGLGEYLQNVISMSFRMSPFSGRTWVRDWTVFYWAWAIAWSPFVGSFIARVSRGRTIREFISGVLFVPAIVAIIWMAVFGGTALHMEMFQGIPIVAAVEQDVAQALFITLENLPLGLLISIVALVLIGTFLITSADSATFVLGIMTEEGKLNPRASVKIIWGVLQAAIASVLLLTSGLQGLQTASLLVALPFTLVLIALCISLLKSLRQEKRQRT